MSERPKLFLSYSHSDDAVEEFAKRLAKSLGERNCITVTDESLAQAGTSWQETLERAIQSSTSIVFIIDHYAKNASQRVQREWEVALESAWDEPSKKLIPVLIGDAKAPAFLGDRKAIQVNEMDQEVGYVADQVAATVRASKPNIDKNKQKALRRDWENRISEIGEAAKSMRASEITTR